MADLEFDVVGADDGSDGDGLCSEGKASCQSHTACITSKTHQHRQLILFVLCFVFDAERNT